MYTQLRSVACKDGRIEYYLTRKKVKNINLRVRSSDGTVRVSASYGVPVGRLDSFVLANAGLIYKAQEALKRDMDKRARYASKELRSGDKLLLLGRELEIRIEKNEDTGVEISAAQLILRLDDPDDTGKKSALLESRLDVMREEIYNKAVDKYFAFFASRGIRRPRIIAKDSVSGWGYCRPNHGLIMMNKKLICVPEALIEYLALHELTHLVHPDHSKAFWDTMCGYMPDCKQRRRQLMQYSYLLRV